MLGAPRSVAYLDWRFALDLVRATARPIVRGDTPKSLAHSVWLLPAANNRLRCESPFLSNFAGRPAFFANSRSCSLQYAREFTSKVAFRR